MREVRLFILPDGSVQLMLDGSITFEEAAAISRDIQEALGVMIPGFTVTQEPEQHKPDGPRHVHLVSTHQARH